MFQRAACREPLLGIRFSWISIFGLLLAFNTWSALQHSLWRDEGQAWMIVRDAMSVGDVLRSLRFEGHPPLWYLCLYGLKLFWGNDPWAMQLLGAFLGTAATVILVSRPFWSNAQRCFLLFNYYLIFEYTLISRSYNLSLFLLSVFVLSATKITQHRFYLEIQFFVLGLLALTGAHAFVVAGVLAFYLMRQFGQYAWRRAIWIYLVLASLSIGSLIPDPEFSFGDPFKFKTSFWKVLEGFTLAVVPVPQTKVAFWNTHLAASAPEALRLGLVAVILGACVWSIRQSSQALVAFVSLCSGLWLFGYVFLPGSNRHLGFFFLGFLTLLLIDPAVRVRLRHMGPVTMLLAGGAAAGVLSLALALQTSFSGSKDAANWIRSRSVDQNDVIVGDPDFPASSILAYLPNRRIYYLSRMEFGTFVRWDKKRRVRRSIDEKLQKVRDFLSEERSVFLVLAPGSDLREHEQIDRSIGLRVVDQAMFRPAVQFDEEFSVFELRRQPGKR